MFKSEFKRLTNQFLEINKIVLSLKPHGFQKNELKKIFPEFHQTIETLTEVTLPKKEEIDNIKNILHQFLKEIESTSLPIYMKTILRERSEDYLLYTNMMEHYGTPFYYDFSRKIYGSSLYYKNKDALSYFFDEISKLAFDAKDIHYLTSEEILKTHRLKAQSFLDVEKFEIKFTTPLLSKLSLENHVLFLNHEENKTISGINSVIQKKIWVELATFINGKHQEDNIWLSSWAPRTTTYTEGLGTLTEILSPTFNKERWSEIILHHLATCMSESGSNIKEVYSFLRHSNLTQEKAFGICLEIFRGVPFDGGMCSTTELLPIHGLIKLLKHLQFFGTDIKSFWIGQLSFEEHSLLHHHTNVLTSEIKHFPEELNSAQAYEKLEQLKILNQKALRSDF